MGAAYLKASPVSAPPSKHWCDGKAAYVNPSLAHAVASRKSYENKEVYRCITCGQWHLGHPMRKG